MSDLWSLLVLLDPLHTDLGDTQSARRPNVSYHVGFHIAAVPDEHVEGTGHIESVTEAETHQPGIW